MTETVSAVGEMASCEAANPVNGAIAFSRGVPPVEAFPAAEIASCFEVVLRDDSDAALQYGKLPGFQGFLQLREQLAKEYSANPDQVFVSNGSLQLFDLLCAYFLHPGCTALTEQPCYDRAITIIRRRGGRAVGVPVEEDGVSIDRLEAAIDTYSPTFFYTVPDFQNPAGATLSLEKRCAILEIAARHNLWIVEDIPYRKLRYQEEDLPLLREIDPTRVITLGSFSKIISPGLRVGFMLGPTEIVRAIAMLGEDTYLSPVIPTQMVVSEYLRRGFLEPTVERLKALYQPRWQAMIEGLCRHIGGARLFIPDGGFFVSVILPPDARTLGLVERARNRGLILPPGRAFMADPDQGEPPNGDHFLRLAFQGVRVDEIAEGLRRLADLI